MKQTNWCFLLRGNQVLLAMKKRGLGEGKWNAVGGKKQEGETIEQAVVREAKEEIGVDIQEKNLVNLGTVLFEHIGHPDWNQEVTAFTTTVWDGDPTESEEMRPKWFDIDKIPFENMWPGDVHWLTPVMQGKKIKAKLVFNEDSSDIISHEVTVVSD